MAKLKENKIINDIRLLALDMIDNAKSGHPGIVLSAAPIIYTLFAHHLNFDLDRPDYANRDRFILSAGHGSSLLYATLFATCNTFDINDLKAFRKLNSPCPGHPEYNLKHRIEATTGLLGQGFANAVGMAISEKYLATTFNSKKNTLFDYNIYVLCGDGDLMEGISYEAASLAGTLNLDNLIVLYDANRITLDGNIEKTFDESVIERFEAMDWNVIEVKNGESVKEINKAIEKAKKNKKPTLIGVNTIIGKYSKYEGTNKIHGNLEKEDLDSLEPKVKQVKKLVRTKSNN